MKIKRVVFVLLVVAQLASTGCWCMRGKGGLCGHRNNGAQNGCFTAPAGCNECSGYGPQMFGSPMTSNAMLQSPSQMQSPGQMQSSSQPVDERLGTPAKQTPYEGPSKKQ